MGGVFEGVIEEILVLMFEGVLDDLDVEVELRLALIFELVDGLEGEWVGVEVEVFLSVGFEYFLNGLAADLFLELLSFLAHGWKKIGGGWLLDWWMVN
jgi:hypothetical protein